MKFRYKKFNGILRPVIPITLENAGKEVRYEVLVDSGADLCLFDADIGEIIGMDIKSGKPFPVAGVGGITKYYLHRVSIEVGGHKYKINTGFLPGFSKNFRYGVVGQAGFFDTFIVKFDLAKEQIELKQRI